MTEGSAARLDELLGRWEPLTWVFTGDSITQGLVHTQGSRCWVEHVHERIRGELGRRLDVVVNTGVAGWTAPLVLDALDHLALRFGPDVVSVALGMNDAGAGPYGLDGFGRDLHAIADRVLDSGAVLVLHTPSLADPAVPGHGDLPAYAQVVREIADATAAILVDHTGQWSRRFGTDRPLEWLDDPFHPNARGHAAMAALTLQSLRLGPLEG